MTVHLQVPLTLDRHGRFRTVDHDSADDVTQSVRTVLLTPPGTRLVDPDYGIEPRFRKVQDLDTLADEIVAFEPRATPVNVQAAVDSAGNATVTVTTGEAT